MTTKSINERLANIKKSLDSLVGVQKHETMTPASFFRYAMDQVNKAASEPREKMVARIKALQAVVSVAKDNYVDMDSESIKVPIFIDDQTALKEQSNTLSTAEQSAAKNPDGESVFEDGFVAKVLAMQKLLNKLAKAEDGEADDEEEEEEEKEDDEEEEETEKAAEDIEEGDDSVKSKSKKGEADAGGDGSAYEDEQGKAKKKPEAEKTKKKIKKTAATHDKDGWPLDMNRSGIEKSSDSWGEDPK